MKLLPLFLIILVTAASAQEPSQDSGLEINDSAYYSMESANMLFGTGQNETAPKSFSMRMYCPVAPIAVSGGLAWTAAISSAISIQMGFQKRLNREQTERQAFSPYFLFDMLPKAAPGSCRLHKDWISQTQDILTKVGIVRLADYPGRAADCHRPPPRELLRKVDRFRIRAMTRLFTSDQTNVQQGIGQKQFVMKRSLGRKHPVVLCIMAGEAFDKLKTDLWKPGTLKQELRTVVVTGYDDQKQAFEIAYPAGKHWGNGGFAWIRYADLVYARYAFEITMEAQPVAGQKSAAAVSRNGTKTNEPAANRAAMQGSLVLNTVNAAGIFEPVKLTRNTQGYYEPDRRYELSTQFQLFGSGTPNTYLYVLGVDPDGRAELHFPYQRTANSRFSGVSSPMLAEARSQVVIPEPVLSYDEHGGQIRREQVFIKEQPGTDWLMAIYSTRKIDQDIGELVKKLNGHNADFPMQLRQFLGKYLIPEPSVQFENHAMKFTAGASPQAFLVPVVIRLEGK